MQGEVSSFSHVKFNRFHKIVQCTDSSLGLIYYRSPALKGDKYICELHYLTNVYMSEFFSLDHHPTYLPYLEDIVTFYLCQLYQAGQNIKWSCHLTQNTLYFLHAIKLWTTHFDCTYYMQMKIISFYIPKTCLQYFEYIMCVLLRLEQRQLYHINHHPINYLTKPDFVSENSLETINQQARSGRVKTDVINHIPFSFW